MRDRGLDTLVIEASSIGLVEHRLEGIDFEAAAFLNLSPDHLNYHGDMHSYAEAKWLLFRDHLRGQALLDIEDPFGQVLAERLPSEQVWRLSLDDPQAEVYFEKLEMDAEGIRGLLRTPLGSLRLQSPLLGRFNARNLACVAALALLIDLPAEAIQEGLREARVRGRLEAVPNDRNLNILIDYAHSADALERVLAALRPLCRGKLWCLFGCGGDRDPNKREPMGRAAAAADGVVLTTDNPRTEDPAQIAAMACAGAVAAGRPLVGTPTLGGTWVELDRRAAIEGLIQAARSGDTLLLAGKGHESYQEIHGVRRDFDDHQVAAEALRGLSWS